jgi:hypothetical protein
LGVQVHANDAVTTGRQRARVQTPVVVVKVAVITGFGALDDVVAADIARGGGGG